MPMPVRQEARERRIEEKPFEMTEGNRREDNPGELHPERVGNPPEASADLWSDVWSTFPQKLTGKWLVKS
jgi:hypothetical protein